MPDPIPSLAEIRDRASMRCLNPSPAMADAIADRRALMAAVEGALAVCDKVDAKPGPDRTANARSTPSSSGQRSPRTSGSRRRWTVAETWGDYIGRANECPNGPHRLPEGPNEDVSQCPRCWLPTWSLRPEGETFGLHLADCSLPERHEGRCVGGGAGHPAAAVIRG